MGVREEISGSPLLHLLEINSHQRKTDKLFLREEENCCKPRKIAAKVSLITDLSHSTRKENHSSL